METTPILSPCGIWGYGFPEESLQNAMAQRPDAIIVDAGSTDAGPHKLGAGVAIVSRKAAKIDLSRLMHAAHEAGIPLLIGSAGGSGARKHTDWTLDIIEEIAREMEWRARIAVIYADIPYDEIRRAREEGRIEKMSPNVPELTDEALEATNGVVAQMGGIDYYFHYRMAELTGNRLVAVFIDLYYDAIRRFAEGSYQDEKRFRQMTREHLRIVEALEKRDKRAAAAAVRSHLRQALRRAEEGTGGVEDEIPQREQPAKR